MHDEERVYLEPWLEAFERRFETPVEVRPVEPDDGGAAGELAALSFPDVFDPPELIGKTGHFIERPEVVAHVRRLGFDWGAEGRILTVPSPRTFNTLVERYGLGARLRVGVECEENPTMSLGPWLLSYLTGRLPLHIAGRDYYETRLHKRGSEGWVHLEFHLASLAHDLSIHALNYHLIPDRFWNDFEGRVRAGLPDRVAGWSAPGSKAPLTLSMFIDNDLNRYCYAVWCRTARPERFAQVFTADANYRQLLHALDTRIEETRSGKGDVASQDTDDMEPLIPVEFEVD